MKKMFKRKSVSSCNEAEAEGSVHERLQEKDVYICEYADKSLYFSGIIKQRFSDFQVNEINCNNEVVRLTSLDVAPKSTSQDQDSTKPADGTSSAVDSEQTVIKEEPNSNTPDADEELYASIDINETPVTVLEYPLSSDDQWKQLALLVKRNKKEESIRMEVTNVEKMERKKIHDLIAEKYRNKLCSNTVVEKDNRKFIVFGTKKDTDRRNLNKWPKDVAPFLYFVLYKENVDTMNAVHNICGNLRIQPGRISYAGSKDRRGVTTQLMCAHRIEINRLINALRQNPRLWVGNFEYKNEPLQLGQLKGNRFQIALRNVISTDEDIEKTLLSLQSNGFINYYGLQRFGSFAFAPTHEIGRCLIKKEWKKAVEMILKSIPSDRETPLLAACKVFSETGNATEAIKKLKKFESTEATILKTLAKEGNTAYAPALYQVPRNKLSMYIHSFQSLVWNRIVSKRIFVFGFKPIAGDLIKLSDEQELEIDSGEDTEQIVDEKSVRPIRENETDTISIYDIVYPLPGHSVKYPDNVISEWYKDFLKEYEIDFEEYKSNKKFCPSGTYRKMMVLPKDVTWRTVRYNNTNANLVQTDLQKIKRSGSFENIADGTHKAVILEFSLPPCTYATMALREVTKADTSVSYQTSLSQSHSQPKKQKLVEE